MFLRLRDLLRIIGVSKSTIYDWIKKGRFPPPRQLGPRCVDWSAEEVQRWIDEREPTHTPNRHYPAPTTTIQVRPGSHVRARIGFVTTTPGPELPDSAGMKTGSASLRGLRPSVRSGANPHCRWTSPAPTCYCPCCRPSGNPHDHVKGAVPAMAGSARRYTP